jgi:flagellar motor protein MotB
LNVIANQTDAENAFITARVDAINTGKVRATANPSATYSVGRNVEPLKIGDPTSVNGQFADMETAMKTRIITALGLDTLTEANDIANANKMAEALIIQLGQDNEEFRAFINDLQAESPKFDVLLNDTTLAMSAPQSATRLAKTTIIANPDLTKGVMKTPKGTFTLEIPNHEENNKTV